jgi:hypothetical protein
VGLSESFYRLARPSGHRHPAARPGVLRMDLPDWQLQIVSAHPPAPAAADGGLSQLELGGLAASLLFIGCSSGSAPAKSFRRGSSPYWRRRCSCFRLLLAGMVDDIPTGVCVCSASAIFSPPPTWW